MAFRPPPRPAPRRSTCGSPTREESAIAVAADAVSNSGYQAANNAPQATHTCAADATLYADVQLLSVAGTVVNSVTYGAAQLVFVGAKASVTGAVRVETWVLANAPAGTDTITANLSAAVVCILEAVSRTGVDKTNPAKGYASAQATNVGAADATVDATTTQAGSWVHAAAAVNDTSVTGNQTERNNVTGAVGSGVDEDTNGAVAVGVTTMSVTGVGAGATWAIGAFEIPPAATFGQGNFRG